MYTSTRSKMDISASKAIIEGIASDGGLYVLNSIKGLKQLNFEDLLNKSYKEMAFIILNEFLDDFNEKNLKAIIDEAYDNTFAYEDVVVPWANNGI